MANPTVGEKLMNSNVMMILVVILAELFGIAALVLLVYWMSEYYGGYSFDKDESLLFAYHPTFMFVGMIFLFGNSMMVFRVTRVIPLPKIAIKLVHGAMHTLSIGFISLGLYAVVRRNNVRGSNIYSYHSWYGVGAIGVFVSVYLFGIVAFLIPMCSDDIKRTVLPLHRFFGCAAFLMATIATMTGLNQLTRFIGFLTGESYSDYPTWGYILNLITLFTGIFVLMVIGVVANSGFQRGKRGVSMEKKKSVELTTRTEFTPF